MKIARYIPPIADDDDFDTYLTQVSSMKELLAIEWVAYWATLKDFIEWKISHNVLLAVMHDNFGGVQREPRQHMVAYAYFLDSRPYIIEEPGYALPNLSDLPP